MILECVECGKRAEGNTGYCASCNRLRRKAATVKAADNNSPINKVSAKTANINSRYLAKLKVWKRGKKCEGHFAHECTGEITCHHMAGRGEGYYDEWAEEQDLPLTLDHRLWKPLCINAHRYIEEHPQFAYENQYSFKRITDPIFRKA
jgi:hypothetical protein